MACGNGTCRAQHPVELFGEDWEDWPASQQDAGGETSAPAPAEEAPLVGDGKRLVDGRLDQAVGKG